MKVLQINKFYFLKGGSERYLFLLSDALTRNGLEIIPFSMKDLRNHPTPYERFFIEPIDFSAWARSPMAWIRDPLRPFYSQEVVDKLSALISETRPDVAHLHNIHFHLTSAVLHVLQKFQIPTVMTLHDYALLAPNMTLSCRGGICPHVREGSRLQWSCMLHRCYDRSLLKTAIAGLDQWWSLTRSDAYDHVSKFIAPSAFLRDTFIRHDWFADRFEVIPYFLQPLPNPSAEAQRDIDVLFVGRLMEEKGVRVLLKALAGLPLKSVIVGSGPLDKSVQALTKSNPSISYHSHAVPAEVQTLMQRSKILVIPSLWPENAPYVILEAMQAGAAIIGSDIGGIPEMLEHGRCGILVPPGDVVALADAIKTLQNDAAKRAVFTAAAQERMHIVYQESSHLKRLLACYHRALV